MKYFRCSKLKKERKKLKELSYSLANLFKWLNKIMCFK
jgi:hypothetical protein